MLVLPSLKLARQRLLKENNRVERVGFDKNAREGAEIGVGTGKLGYFRICRIVLMTVGFLDASLFCSEDHFNLPTWLTVIAQLGHCASRCPEAAAAAVLRRTLPAMPLLSRGPALMTWPHRRHWDWVSIAHCALPSKL